MEKGRVIQHLDHLILFCLCVLVIFLPIAGTETIRAFSLGIPGGLWIVKAILCRRWLFSRTPADFPMLLFTFVAGLSVLTAVDPRYSLQEFTGEWIIGIFLFYLVVNNAKPEQIQYILGALLLGNLIMVGYGIFDFFRDGGQILNLGTRARSLHSGLGTFSTYLVTVIPYFVIAVFYLKETSHRLVILILLSLNLFALLLTYSRGSWVAMMALAFLVGLRYMPRKAFIATLILMGSIIFWGAPQKVIEYYHRFTVDNENVNSYNARWILATFSLEKIKENPLQMNGFGRRTFAKKYDQFVSKYKGLKMWHAHNTFLNLAIQTGLQGFLLFCFLLYRILTYCRERAKFSGSALTGYFSLATFMMIVIFFVRNLSDDFFIDDSALLFWFLCGLVFALNNGLKNRMPTGEDA